MGRLVSWGFLCAKAGHSDRAVRRVEESFSSLVKQGKTYFFKSSQTLRERGAFASGNSCFRNSHEQKLQNSAKPNSGTVRRFSPLKPAFFFGALAWGVW